MVVNSSMEMAVDRLRQVGFSEYEAKAYIALIEDNPLTAYEIAKNSGIPTSKVYEVIRRLESRQIVQSIHGERSKMFVPAPPDEFIQNYRVEMDHKLHAVRNELKDVSLAADMNTGYTWHIKDYENLIMKAKRMLDTARENIIISTWPDEVRPLIDALTDAAGREVKIAMLHFGPTNIRIGQVYVHPVRETVFAGAAYRSLTLVADSKEALNARISDRATGAIWSMNEGFVVLAENYMRHEIYQMKAMKRFEPLLRKEFGERYERLLDIFSDAEASD